MRDEQLHAVVARSTFPSQNVQNTPLSNHFWKLRWRKSAHRCGAKHISKSKCTRHTSPGPLLAVKLRCRKSARRCGATHISKSKCSKHQGVGPLLDVEMLFRVAGARDCRSCQKCAKREGFVAIAKTMAGMGLLKRICKDAFSLAGAIQKTCS